MKIKGIFLGIFVLFFSIKCFAGYSLYETCVKHNNQYVYDVGVNLLNVDTYHQTFNVRFDGDATVYEMDLSDSVTRPYAYDLLKIAIFTGSKVNLCEDRSGLWLLGVEFTGH